MMYVVRRAFRNYGQMIVPGSVVEPGSIKRFKSHLNDRNIIEVTEHNFDKWDKYFRERIGVAIMLPEPDESKPDESNPDESKPDESKPDESKPDESNIVPEKAKPMAKVKPAVAKPSSK